jgi:hypothetical protein
MAEGLQLTPLEEAVLHALLDRPGEPFATLRQQLDHVQITSREFSGAGFFTEFALPGDAPIGRDLEDATFGDVHANLPGLHHGAGFLLFVRQGTIVMLEGFAYGDENWPEITDEFRLVRHDSLNNSRQC